MREIKFRAWDIEDKIMFSCEELCEEKVTLVHINYVNGIDAEVMQYTGLKDKNGVEIYESDIVSVCFNIEEHPQEKVIVEWDTDSYVVKHKISDEFKNIYSLRAIVYECEVIGNIYENKELLEQ